ncbi:MAG: hypothetical protein CM1200mP4_4250 [Rhodospirillaceae bacterium]|nr:MAG: hypothetical protein CM1200mP4_4250 [Rhodospirillaceae bacterium]
MVIMQCDDVERRKKRKGKGLGVRLVTVIEMNPIMRSKCTLKILGEP